MPTIPQEITESTEQLVAGSNAIDQFVHGAATIYIPVRGGTLRPLLYWQGQFQDKVVELAGPYVQQAADSASAAAGSADTATTKAGEASSSANAASGSASTASTKASQAAASASTATTKAGEASSSANAAAGSAQTATEQAARAEGFASGLNLPSAMGNANKILRQKADESGFEYVEEPYPQSQADQRFASLTEPNDFDVMPTVGGSPIVESGSNSDGEWVRWSDGTLWCSRNRIHFASISSTRISAAWTMPAAFLYGGPTEVSHSPNLNSIYSVGWSLDALYCPSSEATGNNIASLHVTVSGQDPTVGWGSVNTYASASGRWK